MLAQLGTAVMKAVALDDTLAVAHNALADLFRIFDWNWVGTKKEYKRATELNPNSLKLVARTLGC